MVNWESWGEDWWDEKNLLKSAGLEKGAGGLVVRPVVVSTQNEGTAS